MVAQTRERSDHPRRPRNDRHAKSAAAGKPRVVTMDSTTCAVEYEEAFAQPGRSPDSRAAETVEELPYRQ